MAINHHQICHFKQFETNLCFSYCQILFVLLSFDFSRLLFAAGCLASWPGGRAALRRMCVTYLPKWTLNNRLWPLSTLSTRLCWGRSYADEDSREFENSGLLQIWGRYSYDSYIFFNEACLYVHLCRWHHCARLCDCFYKRIRESTALWGKVLFICQFTEQTVTEG